MKSYVYLSVAIDHLTERTEINRTSSRSLILKVRVSMCVCVCQQNTSIKELTKKDQEHIYTLHCLLSVDMRIKKSLNSTRIR